MTITEKILRKEYYIHIAIIVVALLLLKSTVSNFILKYVSLSGIFLDFIVMFIIILVVDLIVEEVLNIG